MLMAENLFIVGALLVFLILIFTKKVSWRSTGFLPQSLWQGWQSILIFSLIVFVLVQVSINFLNLPAWVVDSDPLIFLALIVLSQEIVFRGLLVSWLEKWGRHIALWGSTIIFGLIHLIHPEALLITVLSFVGGYFWAWHFLNFRNIYLLTLSHLIVNLSFNYVLLSSLL